MPWWLLAAGFLVTEVAVVHVDVRRETHSISMMELPLVIGLFLASPVAVVVARLVGTGAAVVLLRRQSTLKAAFNLALYGCETVVAIVVFRGLLPSAASIGPSVWLVTFIAMMAANVASVLCVMLVMALHGANLSGRVGGILGGALLPPIANTSLALGAVTLLSTEARSAWLLGAIAVVLAGVYHGYAALKRRYSNLERLYSFTKRLQDIDAETAIPMMLEATRDLMGAERATLYIVEANTVRSRVDGLASR